MGTISHTLRLSFNIVVTDPAAMQHRHILADLRERVGYDSVLILHPPVKILAHVELIGDTIHHSDVHEYFAIIPHASSRRLHVDSVLSSLLRF